MFYKCIRNGYVCYSMALSKNTHLIFMSNKLNNKTNSVSTQQLPKILDIQQVAQTKLFKIESMHLAFSNGEERVFERLKEWVPGVVLMVPMIDEETLLLTKEYAAGINEYTLSFPKGRIEYGEDYYQAANRELQEEIKFKSNRMSYIQGVTSAPNYNATQMHIVLAEDLEEAPLEGDEPEPIVVEPWPIEDVAGLLARSDFHEARSIAALFLVKEHLKNRKINE